MKKSLKTLSLFLVFLCCFSALSACAGKSEKIWIQYKDAKIKDASYRFWFSSIKNNFVTNYEDITDTAECWNRKTTDTEGNSITIGEYVERYAQQYAKNMAIELQLFNDYGLTLPQSEYTKIDNYMDELIYYRYGDSKSALSKNLKKVYNITIDDFRETLEIEAKVSMLEDYLYGEKGISLPTGDELEAYYQDNYMHIQTVLIYTDAEYELDENGKLLLDELGNPKKIDYTEEEKEKKQKAAAAVLKLALSGEDFAGLVEKHSELQNKTPDGFYFCKDDVLSLVARGYSREILMQILKQEIGSVARYETEGEAIFIVKRCDLPEGAYKDSDKSAFFEGLSDKVITKKSTELLESMMADVIVDDELYSMKTVDITKGIF